MPRPDLPAIVARWQRKMTVLAAADALGCWRWLLDLHRHEELVAPELTTWLNTDFFSYLTQRFA